VTKIDITKIDRDFFGVSGLWSEFVDIVGHILPSMYHLLGWYMDVCERPSSAHTRQKRSSVKPASELSRVLMQSGTAERAEIRFRCRRHSQPADARKLQRGPANVETEDGTKEIDFEAFDPTDGETEITAERCVHAGTGRAQSEARFAVNAQDARSIEPIGPRAGRTANCLMGN
jgi:hypothetical protein